MRAEALEQDRFAYEMLVIQSVGTNSAQWQVPGLAIAAQAFLLAIVLNPDTARWPRFAAAMFGLLTTYMTLQLLRRHRYYYQLDKEQLQRLAAPGRLNLTTRDAMKSENSLRPHSLLGRTSSVIVWTVGLTVMMITDLALAVLAWLSPNFFG